MTRMRVRRQSDELLTETILLIASRCECDPTFGATKLNKILFYADFLAYLNLGRSITGQEYFALQQGPAPKRLLPVLKKMQADGSLAILESEFYGKVQRRTIALRQPDVGKFNSEEVDLIHYVIENWWGKTGREISEQSHRFLGWQLAAEKETIPYEAALVGNREPTLDEIQRGLRLDPVAKELLARNAAR